MSYVLFAAALVALAYQVVALLAVLRHLAAKDPEHGWSSGVSILKPVRGLDPGFREAIRSHATQDYPEFEILFGVADAADPAIPEIERLIAEFPDVPIRFIRGGSEAPNRKVGLLAALAAEARHEILIVNDSDVTVPPGYLRDVVAPLQDSRVGVVTCLYRATAERFPGRFEALGIATDFAPSVLVAPLVGVREFGLGSTLVFRAEQLREIGGFPAIAAYLADDYQLAKRITKLGLRVHLSKTVVETALSGATWREVWQHQVRWHRTIRVSKRKTYWGILVPQATFWAVLATFAGWWPVALAAFALRMIVGLLTGAAVLRCGLTVRLFWHIPARDLFGLAVWVAGLTGNTVQWRGQTLRLTADGRIT